MGRRKKIANEILSAEREKFYHDLLDGKLSLAQTSKKMRQLLDLDQAEYAALINVSARTLIDLETEKGNPTLQTLEKLAKPFGLELVFRPRK